MGEDTVRGGVGDEFLDIHNHEISRETSIHDSNTVIPEPTNDR